MISPKTLAPRLIPWLPSIELTFIAAVAICYVVFRKNLSFRPEFILPIAGVATVYIGLLAWFQIRKASDFGLTRHNLGPSFVLTGLIFSAPLLFLLAYGWSKGAMLPAHFFYTLLLYPLWGILQQLVFQGFVLQNLQRLGLGYFSIPLAALAYGLVHWPNPFMLWATGLAGLGFSTIFYFTKNVIPIGIAHGVLGACLFYLYFGRDPFAKFIG